MDKHSSEVPEGGILSQKFLDLVKTIARLRDPQNGCPWDLKQTHESLKPYLIEESYETLDAIDQKNPQALYDELGDVLLQVLLHAQIAKDAGQFDIGKVVENLNDKMIRRHPHIFAPQSGGAEGTSGAPEGGISELIKVKSAEDVTKNWDEIKKSEKKEKHSILEGIPTSLPALLRAEKISKKAVKVGFDWENTQDVISKMKEELAELEEALKEKDFKHSQEEAGDFLFSVVNLLRKLKLNPEESLQVSNNKFVKRFQMMEQMIEADQKKIDKVSLAEWEIYWNKAKLKNQ